MDLQDKVALVTGAGVRVGRELALALGREGARVAVHYHGSLAPAQEVVRLIGVSGGHAAPLRADLRDPAAPARLMDAAAQLWGGVDILINSAAIFVPGDVARCV